MSEELNQTQIVQEFLKVVKSKLPGWLKDNKSELKDVLSELESHIWEKSEEIAGGQDIQIQHVLQAVQDMGNPRDIASEYKKRGTPKVWISKELFPNYLKVLAIVIGVIVGVNIISFIADAATNGFNEDLLTYIDGIISSGLGAFLIVTIIFVALSVEGYLPEDFKKSVRKRIRVSSTPEHPSKPTKRIQPPLRRGGLLAGGIIALLIGLAMIAKAWELIPLVDDIGISLTQFIQIAGIFTMVGGFISLIQSMMELTNYFAQRVLIALSTIADLVFLAFISKLVPAVLHIPAIETLGMGSELYGNIELGITVVMWISIVGTILGSITNISKIITLRMKFEEYLQHQQN